MPHSAHAFGLPLEEMVIAAVPFVALGLRGVVTLMGQRGYER